MWVWDNKYKEYLQCEPGENLLEQRCVMYCWDINPDGEYEENYRVFEENRFYRYQLEE